MQQKGKYQRGGGKEVWKKHTEKPLGPRRKKGWNRKQGGDPTLLRHEVQYLRLGRDLSKRKRGDRDSLKNFLQGGSMKRADQGACIEKGQEHTYGEVKTNASKKPKKGEDVQS